MDLDAIIGVSLPLVIILLVTTAVYAFRRRRNQRRRHEAVTGEVYRSPLVLPVTGWVCAGIGLLLGLMSLSLRGSDQDSLPMMIIGAVLLLVGAAIIERGGTVAWLTEDALKYRKPFRGGTIPYADIRSYDWSTSTTGSPILTAAHVRVSRSDGKKVRFTIAFQTYLDFSPLHQWAELNNRRDLLPEEPLRESAASPDQRNPPAGHPNLR